MPHQAKRDPYRLIGTTLDSKYRLEEYTGSGGMGAVYRALHLDSGQPVAVKILKPDIVEKNPDYVVLFEREVKAVRCLEHPHIVKLLDSGTDQDISYMVMEWLEGSTLEDVISAGQLSIDRIINIFEQICDAFAVAHNSNIIHLDVKPANIMLLSDKQPNDFIKVIDFGMARVLTRESGTTATRFLGTFQYCSPEHFGGVVSHRSDIYSLGVTLYHITTGVIPFGTSYINAKRFPNIEMPPAPSLRGIRPELPIAVDRVIEKALNRNPTERQGSARELFDDFYTAVGIDATRPTQKFSPEPTTFIKNGSGNHSFTNTWQKSATKGRLLGVLLVLMISSVMVTVLYLRRGIGEHSTNPNNQDVSQQVLPKPSPTAVKVVSAPQSSPISSPTPKATAFSSNVLQPQEVNNNPRPSPSTEPLPPATVDTWEEFASVSRDDTSATTATAPGTIEPNTAALPKPAIAVNAERMRVFNLINSERRKRGEKPLMWDDELGAMASHHSQGMARDNFFDHTDPKGLNVTGRAKALGINGWKAMAENIAYNSGYEDAGGFAAERWMTSPRHRANILRGNFTHTGIGVAQSNDGRIYFTQVFVER